MPVIALIGAQWGDEGKGKVVDVLSERVKAVVRFSGGDNAGHTVVNSYGEFPLHLVPSGIFWPHTICIIGNGMAVNPGVLLEEMERLGRSRVDTSRLYISDRANVIMPYHVLLDGLEEKAKGGRAVGTTGKGIGPVFSDKYARIGIRMGELLNKDAFGERDPGLVKLVPLKVFKANGINPVPGLVVVLENNLPGRIQSVSGGRVRIDFNHELAGKTLEYDLTMEEKIADEKDTIKAIFEMVFPRSPVSELKVKKGENETEIVLPKDCTKLADLQARKITLIGQLKKYACVDKIRITEEY